MKKNKYNPEKLKIICKDEMISNYIDKRMEEVDDFGDMIGDLLTLENLKLIELK